MRNSVSEISSGEMIRNNNFRGGLSSVKMVPRPRISFEGNSGAGKSTALEILEKHRSYKVVHEPVETWRKPIFGNMLQNFYEDPKRWSYTFQHLAFSTRIENQRKYTGIEGPILFDRSVMTDREIFARNLHEQGSLSEVEHEMYLHMYRFYTDSFPEELKIHGFIYLRTSPEICHERIKQRNRSEEKQIPIDYLRQLHERHEEWMARLAAQGNPILILDGNSTEYLEDPGEILQKIDDFVSSLSS